MRCTLSLVLSFCAVLLAAPAARAQDAGLLPSTAIRLPDPPGTLTVAERSELETWLAGMRKWQQMDKHWHNEPAHDPFGRIVDRAPRPAAPAWLDARCAALSQDALAAFPAPLGPACRLRAGLDEDPATGAIRASTVKARDDAEKVVKNTFLTRVHIDGLWTSTATDVRIYGLFGSHISLVDIGRVQFFGPPGVIMLSVPDGRGSRETRVGYTWGFSVRLTDVRLFAPSKNLTLFLTVTKVWMTGGDYDHLRPGGMELAGFSLAPRPRR